ncbi:hypothetical protein C0J52_13349 [Blattella germanica]|nr:hypothetical protein C0J52_13349 [Blattella germanica]
MTLASQLDAAASSSGRKNSKKGNRSQKKTSTATPPPPQPAKEEPKKAQNDKHKKWVKRRDAPVEESLLKRSFSIRRQLSNLVSSGGSTLRRSLSFGKGLNDHAPKKPWSASLQSLREDIPEVTVSSPEVRSNNPPVFDSRKLVTRTQSLLVQGTRNKEDDVFAASYQVSFYN